SITAYLGPGCSPTGPADARCICGTATSNMFGDVEFGVVVDDVGEPGVDDVFKIRLTQGGQPVYTTESDSDHTLGGSGPGGGNILAIVREGGSPDSSVWTWKSATRAKVST